MSKIKTSSCLSIVSNERLKKENQNTSLQMQLQKGENNVSISGNWILWLIFTITDTVQVNVARIQSLISVILCDKYIHNTLVLICQYQLTESGDNQEIPYGENNFDQPNSSGNSRIIGVKTQELVVYGLLAFLISICFFMSVFSPKRTPLRQRPNG